MRPVYFSLLFLSVLVAGLGKVVASAFPNLAYVDIGTLVLSSLILSAWLVLEWNGIKTVLGRKGAKYGASSGVSVLLVLGILIGIGVLSNRPRFDKSFDFTRNQINTLSDQSEKIVNQIAKNDNQVSIKAFFQDQVAKDKFNSLLTLYSRVASVFQVEFYDPQTDPDKAIAYKLTEANTVIFEYEGRENRITDFVEEKITNALVNVYKAKTKKIYFTSGHSEGQLRDQDPTSFGVVVTQLENQKYQVDSMSLLEKMSVPQDADLLVIAGPRYDFKEEELRILRSYLTNGGSLFVLIDAVSYLPKLQAFLTEYGIEVQNDILTLSPEDPRAQLLGRNNAIINGFDQFHPVSKDFAAKGGMEIMIPFARSLKISEKNEMELKTTQVAETESFMVRIKGVKSETDLQSIDETRIESGNFVFMAASEGRSKSEGQKLAARSDSDDVSDALKDTGKEMIEKADKPIRLVVAGSSQFARDQLTKVYGEARDLFSNTVSYLLQDEDFISIRPKEKISSSISVASGSSQLMLLFFSYVYPFIFLAGGIFYWVRRRQA